MDVFLGGTGGEEKASGYGHQGRSLDDVRFQTAPFCYILYVEQWCFSTTCLQTITKGVLDPRLPWADASVVRLRHPVELVHSLKMVKGLWLLVPPQTPRSSGYDVYAHAVYVVICYMSITCICLLYVVICYMSVICYVSVICLVLGSSCYMYMSVICCYVLYVCCMLPRWNRLKNCTRRLCRTGASFVRFQSLHVCYMSSARGGSRVRLYII